MLWVDWGFSHLTYNGVAVSCTQTPLVFIMALCEGSEESSASGLQGLEPGPNPDYSGGQTASQATLTGLTFFINVHHLLNVLARINELLCIKLFCSL